MDPGLKKDSAEANDSQAQAAAIRSLEQKYEELRARCERLLAHQALIDNRLLNIETNRLFRAWNKTMATGAQALEGVRRIFGRSPGIGEKARHREADSYARWVSHEQSELLNRPDLSRGWARRPLISVVVALKAWSRGVTDAGLQSILDQTYPCLEICIAYCQDTEPLVNNFCSQARETGCAARATPVPGDAGMAAATNAAAALAEGEYLLFFDSNDLLSPFALYDMVAALQDAESDIFYADEDQLDSEGRRSSPLFKPDWSPDLLTSCMYLGRPLAVKRNLFLEIGGLQTEFESAEHYDLALRLTEVADGICHIPRVLNHRRPELESAANRPGQERRALDRAMERRGWPGTVVEPGALQTAYSAWRPAPPDAALSIVVCSKNSFLLRRCLESVQGSSANVKLEILVVNHEEGEPNPGMKQVLEAFECKVVEYGGSFNFSVMNNLAAAQAANPFILFLNDDVTFESNSWAARLLGHLQRPEVGIVGATLFYPSGTLQHAGIALGVGDGAGHVGRFEVRSELWPWLAATRNVSAVTGAFLGIRTALFRDLGGFDSNFNVNYNDVDLCLRAGAAGYSVLCMAENGIVHQECQTRRGVTRLRERELLYARWGHRIAMGDPFYSRNLLASEQIALNLGEEQNRTFESLKPSVR